MFAKEVEPKEQNGNEDSKSTTVKLLTNERKSLLWEQNVLTDTQRMTKGKSPGTKTLEREHDGCEKLNTGTENKRQDRIRRDTQEVTMINYFNWTVWFLKTKINICNIIISNM